MYDYALAAMVGMEKMEGMEGMELSKGWRRTWWSKGRGKRG